MNTFIYIEGQLHAEQIPVSDLAERYGTPLYVYSENHLKERYQTLADAMSEVSPLICFSMKANSNAATIKTFAEQGAGVDIVSGGELYRALRAGVDPQQIVFAGVGKTREDIEYALKENILFFTCESEPEADRIADVAESIGAVGRIAFRVNPDVDPQTHKYISTGKKENKFGLNPDRVIEASNRAAGRPGVEVVGLHMHIGSQILTPVPFGEAIEKVEKLCNELRPKHPNFKYLDIGGGLGIQYSADQEPLPPATYAEAVIPAMKRLGLSVVMEPGRFLVGNSGILVTRVQYVKDNAFKKFIVIDAGMNDLLRPALYQAHHDIMPVTETDEIMHGDLVGPICESGDFLAKDRDLPAAKEGDLLAARSAGAYGFTMASTYNSRPRPAEVMVNGSKDRLIGKRETWEDLVRLEV